MTRLAAALALLTALGGCSFAGKVHLGDVFLGFRSGGFATVLGAGHHAGIAIR
ncbi:MAG TPA: hypothetical protein VFZ01_02645 [Geminicoccaceae bacterium]